jgi:uncharacterized cupredoxin-like copper-binding protein
VEAIGGAGTRRAATLLLIAAVAAATFGACSSGPGSSAPVVDVRERDFRITMTDHLAPGDYVLSVRNDGPVSHELIVVKANHADLPLRSDGLTVDEESMEHEEVGALEPGEPGGVRELPVHLTAGRYEVFCNMAGHYFGGMRTSLVVS